MKIKISILNEFNTELSTYVMDLGSYKLSKKHNISIEKSIDEMIHKIHFEYENKNIITEIPNPEDFMNLGKDAFNKNKQETIEETCDRLFPTAAIERKIVKENQQKDKLAIEFGEWLCEKAEVPYIKGTMGGTLEVFKKEKGII